MFMLDGYFFSLDVFLSSQQKHHEESPEISSISLTVILSLPGKHVHFTQTILVADYRMNPPGLFPAADENGEVGILEKALFPLLGRGQKPAVPVCSGSGELHTPLCKG